MNALPPARPAAVEEAPDPAPQAAPAGPPPFAPKSAALTAAYMGASMVIALSQSLGQGFLTANLPQLAGELGVDYSDALWLNVAFLAPRASLSLLLVKIRAQYGLRRFAEVSIVLYALVAAISFWTLDLRSAIAVELLSGISSAPLSTLAFLYMLEPLPQEKKLHVGMPLALTFISLGTPLARALSPALTLDGGWTEILILKLGMSMICLALVFRLPLANTPRVKAIHWRDLLSFVFLAAGFGALVGVFSAGATWWWLAAPWLGRLLAGGIAATAIAMMLELFRREPFIDVRFLMTPEMLHLTGALLLLRIILSEQTAGAPGLFQALGYAPEQTAALFGVICGATLLGGAACATLLTPARVPVIHAAALALIALGAGMEADANADVAPAQMMLSQGLVGFGAALFLPPAMARGMMKVLPKGPVYLLNFIILFLATQIVGGAIGSGLFRSFVAIRVAAHTQWLKEGLATGDPLVSATLSRIAAALAPSISDPALRAAEAAAQLSSAVARQAASLAYDDAFRLISLLACFALAALICHILHDHLRARIAAAPEDLPR